MAFRLEEKIELHITDYPKVMSLINKCNGNEIYKQRKISSIYFDNKNQDMFLDSEEGILPRKKIRIRNYPEEKITSFNFEKKISSVEGKFKISRHISLAEYKNYYKKGVFDSSYGLCIKNLYVSYIRKYFKIEDIRITIDKNILFESPDKKKRYLEDKNLILEIKGNKPSIKEIFNNELPYQRSRYSKYCIGINRLYGKDHYQRYIK